MADAQHRKPHSYRGTYLPDLLGVERMPKAVGPPVQSLKSPRSRKVQCKDFNFLITDKYVKAPLLGTLVLLILVN